MKGLQHEARRGAGKCAGSPEGEHESRLGGFGITTRQLGVERNFPSADTSNLLVRGAACERGVNVPAKDFARKVSGGLENQGQHFEKHVALRHPDGLDRGEPGIDPDVLGRGRGGRVDEARVALRRYLPRGGLGIVKLEEKQETADAEDDNDVRYRGQSCVGPGENVSPDLKYALRKGDKLVERKCGEATVVPFLEV